MKNSLDNIGTIHVDPVNDNNYYYRYYSDGKDWELDAILESQQYKSKMSTDNGDDPTAYEIGSNLQICRNGASQIPLH